VAFRFAGTRAVAAGGLLSERDSTHEKCVLFDANSGCQVFAMGNNLLRNCSFTAPLLRVRETIGVQLGAYDDSPLIAADGAPPPDD
jgi:hypothetical protein